METVEGKECPQCKEWKLYTEYYKWCCGKDGLDRICKTCKNTYRTEYSRKNREKQRVWGLKWYKEKGWKNKLDQTYGPGASKHYEARFVKQNGVCEICGEPAEHGHKLGLDHNHETGQWRGLLCRKCNTGLGGFRTDGSLELLYKAIEYMEKYNEF